MNTPWLLCFSIVNACWHKFDILCQNTKCIEFISVSVPGTCSLVYLICALSKLVPDLEQDYDEIFKRNHRCDVTAAFTATIYSGFVGFFAIWGVIMLWEHWRELQRPQESFKWLFLAYTVFQVFVFVMNMVAMFGLLSDSSKRWEYVEISLDIFWQMIMLCVIV